MDLDRFCGPVALFPSAYEPSLGGVEELSHQLAAHLQARSVPVTVHAPLEPRTLARRELVRGVAVVRQRYPVPEPRPRHLLGWVRDAPGAYRQVRRTVRAEGAQLVHVECVSANAIYARHAATRLRLPLVVSLQGEVGMDAGGVYRTSTVLPRLLASLLATADRITACSRAALEEAIGFTGIDPGPRACVVPNGVDPDEFAHPQPPLRARPYVFAMGRLVPQKGFDVLIEAFTSRRELGPFDLVIAGDGPERSRLDALARRSDRVHLVGRADRAQVASYLQHAEVFVLPSRHEPQGIVVLEAMAAGCPVIASRVGGVPEMITDPGVGVLVPPGDARSLGFALVDLLGDERWRAHLRQAGRTRAADYSWTRMTDRYLEVYAAAAEHAARARPPAARPAP